VSTATTPKYRPETRLVQSGVLRSQFGETSEALFLTQGYVYESSAQAEARFKGEDPGYQYSRFANPTVSMFERRIAEFEGAEAARATATGMAAVTLAMMGQVRAGDHVVASKAIFGSCLYVVEEYLPRYGVTSTIVDDWAFQAALDTLTRATRPGGLLLLRDSVSFLPDGQLVESNDYATRYRYREEYHQALERRGHRLEWSMRLVEFGTSLNEFSLYRAFD